MAPTPVSAAESWVPVMRNGYEIYSHSYSTCFRGYSQVNSGRNSQTTRRSKRVECQRWGWWPHPRHMPKTQAEWKWERWKSSWERRMEGNSDKYLDFIRKRSDRYHSGTHQYLVASKYYTTPLMRDDEKKSIIVTCKSWPSCSIMLGMIDAAFQKKSGWLPRSL